MEKIVLFGGAFDLLHAGHVRQISRARSYGDYLIINLSSDRQVSKKKGITRPIIPEEDRAEMLISLRDVDEVICPKTDELDLPYVLALTKPNVLVTNKGNNDYNKECKKRGIKLVKLSRCIPKSKLDTTEIITKIKGG